MGAAGATSHSPCSSVQPYTQSRSLARRTSGAPSAASTCSRFISPARMLDTTSTLKRRGHGSVAHIGAGRQPAVGNAKPAPSSPRRLKTHRAESTFTRATSVRPTRSGRRNRGERLSRMAVSPKSLSARSTARAAESSRPHQTPYAMQPLSNTRQRRCPSAAPSE